MESDKTACTGVNDCKHSPDEVCDALCICTCDECVDRYTAEWEKRAALENLCTDCGMPKSMTVESLKEEEYTHFYQPCIACRAPYKELMKVNNLCEDCRDPLVQGKCPGCVCVSGGEYADCPCRQCKAARKAEKHRPDYE